MARSGMRGARCDAGPGFRYRLSGLRPLPDKAAAETFWNEEPFARNGGYGRDPRMIRWVFAD